MCPRRGTRKKKVTTPVTHRRRRRSGRGGASDPAPFPANTPLKPPDTKRSTWSNFPPPLPRAFFHQDPLLPSSRTLTKSRGGLSAITSTRWFCRLVIASSSLNLVLFVYFYFYFFWLGFGERTTHQRKGVSVDGRQHRLTQSPSGGGGGAQMQH